MQEQNAEIQRDPEDFALNPSKDDSFAVDFLKALKKLQDAMKGEAEKAGLYTDEDVMNLIKEIRDEDPD